MKTPRRICPPPEKKNGIERCTAPSVPLARDSGPTTICLAHFFFQPFSGLVPCSGPRRPRLEGFCTHLPRIPEKSHSSLADTTDFTWGWNPSHFVFFFFFSIFQLYSLRPLFLNNTEFLASYLREVPYFLC